MPPSFSHFDLRLVEPAFGDDLIDLILNLNDLRTRRLSGTTNPLIFFQLKHIFHTLESIGSARIEGNRTTIAEYIETKLEGKSSDLPDIHEIQNMERAMEFIDQNVKDHKIDRLFVSELHKIIVDGHRAKRLQPLILVVDKLYSDFGNFHNCLTKLPLVVENYNTIAVKRIYDFTSEQIRITVVFVNNYHEHCAAAAAESDRQPAQLFYLYL